MPSGTADIALNVTVEEGQLAKRDGFKEFEDNVAGGSAILFMDVAHFANGDTFVIVKLADAKLYHRQVEPSDAGTWTSFSLVHDASDVGWSYMWADRWFYFDSTKSVRWDGTTAYTAGLAKPSVLPNPIIADGGALEGTYHVYTKVRNTVTGEESIFGEATGAIETRNSDAAAGTGGAIIIDNNAAVANSVKDGSIDGDFDVVVYYRGLANSGLMGTGAGAAFPAYIAYQDIERARGEVTANIAQGDDGLFREQPMLNVGGVPPLSEVGVFNGIYGIYGQTATAGRLSFSLPNLPTMVPDRAVYGNGKLIEPRPWVGNMDSGAAGPMTGIVFGGGATVLFTPTSTWSIGTRGDARLFTKQRHGSKGCAAIGACVSTPAAVHAIGHQSWLVVTADVVVDLALHRFQKTLADIPADQQGKTRMGYYSFKNQVWAAVVKDDQTLAKRILIWDPEGGQGGALTIYEPTNLAGGEGITAIVELTIATETPTMLLATNLGRIIQFPDTANARDETVGYVAIWQGYFGQEGAGSEQVLDGIDVHAGANVGTSTTSNVTLTTRPMRSGQDTQYAAKAQALTDSNNIIPDLSIIADKQWGRMWQVKLSSLANVAAKWSIPGMTFRTKPT